MKEMAVNTAFHCIVKKLVSGKISPGTSVYESEFTKELDLSRMPVRQALSKAVSLGILNRIPGKRGYLLPKLTLEDLVMVMEMRSLIEGTAAYKAAKYATYEDIYKLRVLLDEDIHTYNLGSLSEYAVSNERIHSEIVKISRNLYIQNSFSPLYWRSSLYDYKYLLNVANSPPGVVKTYKEKRPICCDEHLEIIINIEKNDPNAAKEAMELHITKSLEFLKHSIRFSLS